MENQEIDATKASINFEEDIMLNVISSALGSGYDKDLLIEDIKQGKLKPSDIVGNPSILEKYRVPVNE